MTNACQYIHEALRPLPRFRAEDIEKVHSNGLYVLFEAGEQGHGGDRIVRIGTHRGQGRLASRIKEHLFTPNKDRSIFRKHVGRCLLARANDGLLEQWETDLTSKVARSKFGRMIDFEKLRKVETDVTHYMVEHFSVVVLRFDERAKRMEIESKLIATVAQCPACGPSPAWLGKFHPESAAIRVSGLWNVQGLRGSQLTPGEAREVIDVGTFI